MTTGGKTSNTVTFYCKDKLVKKNNIEYYEAYPVLEYQKPDNAISWATLDPTYKTYTDENTGYSKYLLDENEQRVINEPAKPPKIITCLNKFSNIELITIVRREQGGRAWKILVPVENVYVYIDMREEEVLEVIKNGNIKKGILLDDFVLISYGDMKVTRIGSENYIETMKRCDEEMNYVKPKSIPFKNMKVGYLYSTESGTKAYYLGKFKFKDTRQSDKRVNGKYVFKDVEGVNHFFIETYKYDESVKLNYFCLSYKKSSSFIKEESFNSEINMEEIKQTKIKECEVSLKERQERRNQTHYYQHEYIDKQIDHYKRDLAFLNSIEEVK